jgi:EAL domain-containing protein (putative c-di-GMP-specific phosphodiesterase class I)/GGDEF domain-containing protein
MTELQSPTADKPISAGRQHQLPHEQLVDYLHSEIEKDGTRAISVLILELGIANRMDVLTGGISMQAIKRYIAQHLDNMLRPADRYTNFSGEQMCLVLPNIANKEQAVLAAINIISELQKPFTVGKQQLTLRPYIGIANFPELGTDTGQLLMFADIASSIAASKENRYHVYRLEDQVETESYIGLDIDLDKALKANELRVNYQPQIDIRTGRCISAEALVRWNTPGRGEINPGALVRIAESRGLIAPLTMMILNTALRHTAAFAAAGVDIGISVNLPPKMLEDNELPLIIQQSLDIWGVPATKLTLEITEGSIVKNSSSFSMLSRLRNMGLSLAIDDFGTGYSSLAYLKSFQAQELKIDILFVKNIHKSRGDRQLVQAIIDLAHNFDMITVAEGVEDQKTIDLLRELGCDVVQGFLFSRALPDTDFLEWYRLHN